jgi:hypothetical protein
VALPVIQRAYAVYRLDDPGLLSAHAGLRGRPPSTAALTAFADNRVMGERTEGAGDQVLIVHLLRNSFKYASTSAV